MGEEIERSAAANDRFLANPIDGSIPGLLSYPWTRSFDILTSNTLDRNKHIVCHTFDTGVVQWEDVMWCKQ